MPVNWTVEQIMAMAPDASSAKSGKSLATSRKWALLGCDERAAWGECRGSAKESYRAQIDLSELAFRCSCPSRKFPCKHALGLFLLLVNEPSAFKQTAPPDWVKEWLEGRARRAEQRAKKKERAQPVVDTKAQARRAADRQAKVVAGMQELELWLRDLARQGLANAQGRPASFWKAPQARLLDAQAPGLARWVRDLAGIPASGEGWHGRLLERLGRIHLLIEGFKRMDGLPPATQADIRMAIGWTQNQDELLAEAGLRDRWMILAQRVEDEEKLRVQRTWLWGLASSRAALVLDFALGKQPLDTSLVPGVMMEAELVFFPGACPLRALVKARNAAPVPLSAMPGYPTLAEAIKTCTSALALNPWLEYWPISLQGVVPLQRDGKWILRDAEGRFLPIAPQFEPGWQLLALSGGHPLTLFGEWDGDYVLPLSAWADGRFVRL